MTKILKVDTRRMAYLSAQHPMLSMIFIVREIAGLEQMGFDIEVASVNSSDRPRDKLTSLEAGQSDKTYYIKAHGLRGALAAHAQALVQRPGRYLKGWRSALSLAGLDPIALVKHAMYLTEALMLGRWMQSRRLEHVHVHLGSQPATVGLLAKQVFDIGLSVTVHGADEFYDAFRQHLPEKVAAADFIVCISHFARSQLMFVSQQQHWAKLLVCRLGVDVSHFAPRLYTRTSAQQPFNILCVGRLSPAKGQQLLIEAVSRLKAMGRPVRLEVVGGGANAAALERMVEERDVGDSVLLTGPVNPDRIREHYARADCFCLPSFTEGIPVVLMEAMAMQIPCVTTHITGIPELISHGATGLLVPPSDVDALVEQLDRLIIDPALAKQLGERARLQVQEQYDLHRNIEKLAGIFRERVVDSARGSSTAPVDRPLTPAG